MRTLHEIAAAALLLSLEDRRRLVDVLLLSLNEPSPVAFDDAWGEEVERRLKEINEGMAASIPVDIVFAEAHKLAS
jgi:putative addiction module component (TIGR02574 family)